MVFIVFIPLLSLGRRELLSASKNRLNTMKGSPSPREYVRSSSIPPKIVAFEEAITSARPRKAPVHGAHVNAYTRPKRSADQGPLTGDIVRCEEDGMTRISRYIRPNMTRSTPDSLWSAGKEACIRAPIAEAPAPDAAARPRRFKKKQ